MCSIKNLKQYIDNQLPNDKSELSYILDRLGKILFKHEWNTFRPLQITKVKFSNIGLNMIK